MKPQLKAMPDADIDTHVGARIRDRRRAVGMTQTELGAAIGVKFQQVQKYETGANRVSASKLFRIAEVLACDLHYFWNGLPAKYALDGARADDLASQSKVETAMLTAFRACQDDVKIGLLVLVEAAADKAGAA
ncbi:helix-turn-helix domain-containing protein [Roseovarius nitratireducens]|uniref:helix-turn-helix domain-containing protein n=1 Tax=Roseovarius nitratireducens TaxID=2044597 RepID=UPI001F0BF124|nr:helix-turn-helix transcriptional regulator [Roseovarius nitratireducens]